MSISQDAARETQPFAPMMSRESSRDIKREFGARLRRRLQEKGWNQSELARRASVGLEHDIGRDSISGYIRGRSLPGPVHLRALCRALDVTPSDLLPTDSLNDEDRPNLEMKQVPGQDALVDLSVRVRLPLEAALDVMQIIKNHKGRTSI